MKFAKSAPGTSSGMRTVEVALPGRHGREVAWRSLRVLQGYAQREDALRDLGVSEDALEPIAP